MATKKKRKKRRGSSPEILTILMVVVFVVICVIAIFLIRGCASGKKSDTSDTKVTVEETKPETAKEEKTEENQSTDQTEDATDTKEDESQTGQESDEQAEAANEADEDADNAEESTPAEELPAQTFGTWDLSTLSGESVPYGFNRDKTDSKGAPEGIGYYKSKWGQYKVDFISDRTDENVIYLTMDEGFANEQTAQVLDILKEKNVKVTFFCTSDFVNNCPQFIERMINEGHRIGCHSITHRKMPTLDLATQKEEIMDVVNIMKEKYNYDVRLFRFPEGEFSDQSLALVENCGLKSVFWSFAYRDFAAEQPDVQESLQLTLNSVHPGAIYLLHANSATNLAFLPDFIDGVRAKGYEFAGVYPVD